METNKIHQIDATGRALGRVASEAAVALRGKNSPHFEQHLLSGQKVEIHNVSKLKIMPLKAKKIKYERYTGYPGGLRFTTLPALIAKKGYGEPLRRAVRGMLPANKLRAKLMLNLKIYEDE